ncbi:MAG: efflux RND transporter periplasmic adaptor subunit [Bacteroidota bacterium]|nr:efflux RND transporter periplasmic adaptor subunit [Bacteroidota bacterium]
MRIIINIFRVLLILVVFDQQLISGGNPNDGHTHGEVPVAKPVSNSIGYHSIENNSDKYEVLLRYGWIKPNEGAQITLFISDNNTNKPIPGAKLSFSVIEDSSITFEYTEKEIGIYQITARFPKMQSYSVAIKINANLGLDLILLQGLEIGKSLEISNEHIPHSHWWQSLGFWIPVSLILGMSFMWFLNLKMRKKIVSISLLIVLFVTPIPFRFENAFAHGGEEHHSNDAQQLPSSNQFTIPKETQFLFDITTQKVFNGLFNQSLNLFGTIQPASDGYAKVTTPNSGIVRSVQVKVGQPVKAGQILATFEQFMDAATQINIGSERSVLMAELEAAQKEWNRLQSIRDIIAKKELDEAQARLNKARENLKFIKSNRMNTLSIRSPINGIVGSFLVSIGSSLTMGQELFNITNINKVYIEAQVFDKDLEKLADATSYIVECTNNDHSSSKVKLISSPQTINPTNQSQRLLFELDNTDSNFKIGEFVNIKVNTKNNTNSLALMNSALNELNGKPIVFTKVSAEKFSIQFVQLGENNGSHTVVLKGLRESERVIINGVYQMKMMYLNQ